jgi:hypothetical protein
MTGSGVKLRKIVSDIKQLTEGDSQPHGQHCDLISLHLLFQNIESKKELKSVA